MGIFGGFGGDPNAIAVNERNVQPGLAALLGQAQGQMLQPAQGQQAINQYAQMPQQQAPEQPKGGFFSHGLGAVLANAFGGALDGAATHFGAPGGFAASQARQAEEAKFLQRMMLEAQQAAQARQQTRQEGNQDWQSRYDYEAANPKQGAPVQSPEQRLVEWANSLPPDQRQNALKTLDQFRPKVVGDPLSGYQPMARPGSPVQFGGEAPDVLDPETVRRMTGGGASNGTGGFRP